MASASRSKTLMEYQRTSSGPHWPLMPSAIWARACSTSGEKSSSDLATACLRAASSAWLTSLSRFLLRRAETSTTGTPSMWESFFVSMVSPRWAKRSHMLRPTTTGRPVSRIWVVR